MTNQLKATIGIFVALILSVGTIIFMIVTHPMGTIEFFGKALITFGLMCGAIVILGSLWAVSCKITGRQNDLE